MHHDAEHIQVRLTDSSGYGHGSNNWLCGRPVHVPVSVVSVKPQTLAVKKSWMKPATGHVKSNLRSQLKSELLNC